MIAEEKEACRSKLSVWGVPVGILVLFESSIHEEKFVVPAYVRRVKVTDGGTNTEFTADRADGHDARVVHVEIIIGGKIPPFDVALSDSLHLIGTEIGGVSTEGINDT